ncbi:MAG: Na+/H+ antiporter subunit G [Marinobacter sp.]|uniref:Na+/H+ antiporter subunit G n=1 Tax=Marinobacter sp. TaxID=50741 RepID=UPI00299D81EE|nr:Na+/H+ antiporter subunit G [Marinobacter sp.]MDX1634228.1 Na+/H+ antiporter subunit G [Marinobacter sp.]
MTAALEILVSVLLVMGGGFALVGAIGLARLPDFYTRLHGPTKATTLGVGSIVLASILFFYLKGEGLAISEVLLLIFLFLTAPVSANMLSKAAMHIRAKADEDTRGNLWDQ